MLITLAVRLLQYFPNLETINAVLTKISSLHAECNLSMKLKKITNFPFIMFYLLEMRISKQ